MIEKALRIKSLKEITAKCKAMVILRLFLLFFSGILKKILRQT